MTDSRPCQRCTLPIIGEVRFGRHGAHEIWSGDLRVGIKLPSSEWVHVHCNLRSDSKLAAAGE